MIRTGLRMLTYYRCFCDDLLIALPGLKGVPLIKLKEPFEPLSTLVSCTSTQLHTINPFLLMIAHAQKQCFTDVKNVHIQLYTYCHFMVFDRCVQCTSESIVPDLSSILLLIQWKLALYHFNVSQILLTLILSYQIFL